MRLTLFVPCYADALYPESAIATVRLLERLGHEVVFPEDQTCCGQMHVNTGYAAEALRLERRFVDVFGDADVVVAPSASCVGTVRQLYGRLARRANDTALEDAAERLAGRVFELSELLVGPLGLTDVGACFPGRVAYHPTCHSLRALRLGEGPETLLRAVRGLELVPLAHAKECCGFGGTFAVKNPETSVAMLADKLAAIGDSGADACVAVDGSCLMHIAGGLSRAGSKVRALHLAEILAAAAPA